MEIYHLSNLPKQANQLRQDAYALLTEKTQKFIKEFFTAEVEDWQECIRNLGNKRPRNLLKELLEVHKAASKARLTPELFTELRNRLDRIVNAKTIQDARRDAYLKEARQRIYVDDFRKQQSQIARIDYFTALADQYDTLFNDCTTTLQNPNPTPDQLRQLHARTEALEEEEKTLRQDVKQYAWNIFQQQSDNPGATIDGYLQSDLERLHREGKHDQARRLSSLWPAIANQYIRCAAEHLAAQSQDTADGIWRKAGGPTIVNGFRQLATDCSQVARAGTSDTDCFNHLDLLFKKQRSLRASIAKELERLKAQLASQTAQHIFQQHPNDPTATHNKFRDQWDQLKKANKHDQAQRLKEACYTLAFQQGPQYRAKYETARLRANARIDRRNRVPTPADQKEQLAIQLAHAAQDTNLTHNQINTLMSQEQELLRVSVGSKRSVQSSSSASSIPCDSANEPTAQQVSALPLSPAATTVSSTDNAHGKKRAGSKPDTSREVKLQRPNQIEAQTDSPKPDDTPTHILVTANPSALQTNSSSSPNCSNPDTNPPATTTQPPNHQQRPTTRVIQPKRTTATRKNAQRKTITQNTRSSNQAARPERSSQARVQH